MSPSLDRLSLRTRLVAGTVLLVAAGLLVAGVAATSALRGYQLSRVDEQLSRASSSPALRDGGGLGRGGGGGRGRPGPPARLPGELYRALLDASGAVVGTSATRGDEGPQVPVLTAADAAARGLDPFTVDAADGEGQWRVVAVPVDHAGSTGTLLLASDLGEVERTVDRLVALQLVIGLLVLAGITGLGLLVVRSSLRGLVEVEQAASAVAAGRLDRRVPQRHEGTEVGRLASSFNHMVAQVQAAFAAREASEQRLRRFVADAGHELRTPLTSIRGFAELHRQGAVTEPAEVTRLLRRIEDEASRMGVLVEDLLTLARLDEQRPLQLQDVDLAVVAADAVHDAAAVHPQRRVTLDVPGPVVVRGDDGRLRQVLTNLLANAFQHTPPDAAVAVRVRREAGAAVLEVADAGPGMPPETASRVFERFYRADASRTRASGGSGLGLSIVASLVQAHGGRVELDTAPGRGSAFRVLLPADAA
jgi:two-component system, OmpR family, sensor kinase